MSMNKRMRLLNRALRRCALGSPIVILDEVGSTNDILKQLAEAGAPEGCTVVAESQTKGRGRMGKKWLSLEGKGLYMSVLLRPRWHVSDSSTISMFSALAVARALKRAGVPGVSLKWPNDVVSRGGKIAGILVEPDSRKSIMNYCVIGIGVNLSHSSRDLAALGSAAGASCRTEGASVGKDEALIGVLKEMQGCYRLASAKGERWVEAEWAAWSRPDAKNSGRKGKEKNRSRGFIRYSG